jgi:integrase/recombinase XerD
LSHGQVRQLLKLSAGEGLKQKRDRALLSVLFYPGLRRHEAAILKVSNIQRRRGVPTLRITGKGGKTRYVPLHPETHRLLLDYLDAFRHGAAPDGAPLPTGTAWRELGAEAFDAAALSADGIYKVMCIYTPSRV